MCACIYNCLRSAFTVLLSLLCAAVRFSIVICTELFKCILDTFYVKCVLCCVLRFDYNQSRKISLLKHCMACVRVYVQHMCGLCVSVYVCVDC